MEIVHFLTISTPKIRFVYKKRSLDICDPITTRVIFDSSSTSPEGQPLVDPLFPAKGDEFIQRSLEIGEIFERDALTYHLAELQTKNLDKKQTRSQKEEELPTRAPIRMLRWRKILRKNGKKPQIQSSPT